MKKKTCLYVVCIILFFAFMLFSYITGFPPGKAIGNNFMQYSVELVKILPFAFILIGLFEVWVKRETVEKHLGAQAGMQSYLWAIILGSTTIGPMIVALPIAHTLFSKGARLSVIFAYVGAAAVCRIPMTIFEASYLGIAFTIIRYAVSIPLIIITSSALGKYLEKKDYKIIKGSE